MSLIELTLIAIALSMDAFAIAICIGLNVKANALSTTVKTGLYFGLSQAIMPIIGYYTISFFVYYMKALSILTFYIKAFDHWLALGILLFLGGKMLYDHYQNHDCTIMNNTISFKTMLPLSITTSIDALAVGISLAFLQIDIIFPALLIGCITFFLSVLGVNIGLFCGIKFRSIAQIAGGIILIVLGFKILFEHLMGN